MPLYPVLTILVIKLICEEVFAIFFVRLLAQHGRCADKLVVLLLSGRPQDARRSAPKNNPT